MGATAQFAATLARHAGRAAVPALAGALLALFVISSSGADQYTATAQVAVSDAVRWPFYTSARERILQIARDEDLQATVRQQLAGEPIALDAEPTEGEIIVGLSAEARTQEAALAAANAYAEEVVAANLRPEQEQRQQRIAELEALIATIDERIAANDSELAAVSVALAADPGPADEAVLRSRQQRLESSQRQDASERTQLLQALTAAQLDSDDVEPEIELLSRAAAGGTNPVGDPSTLAILAALPLFLLGIGASVLWDQTVGYVRRPSDLRWATSAPVAVVTYVGPPEAPIRYDSATLVRRLVRRGVPGCQWSLVPVGRVAAEPFAAHLSLALEGSGSGSGSGSGVYESSAHRRNLNLTPAGLGHQAVAIEHAGEGGGLATQVEVPPHEEEGVDGGVSLSCGAVLVVARRTARLPAVRQAVRELEVEGLRLEAVAFLAP